MAGDQGATIAAVSSPPGPGRRGIVRLSGPRTGAIVAATFRTGAGAPPALARRAVLGGSFDDGTGTQPALLFWMPGPRSSTREDVAELHLAGAEPLLRCAMARLASLGASPAAPGEFTRRAFLAGRIDLSQAEGVLQLVEATHEGERRAAARLLEGGLGERARGLREQLEDLRALAEATLDFDEAETGHVPATELLAGVDAVAAALGRALAWEVARQPASSLPRVVLFGAPNAGKSTLFNALVGEERALTSELAGTTRDVVSGIWRVGEAEMLLVDAPGQGAFLPGPDALALEHARRERRGSDLVLWVVDASTGEESDAGLAEIALGAPAWLLVWSQIDRPGAPAAPSKAWLEARGLAGAAAPPVAVSARTREGLDALAAAAGASLGGAASAGELGRALFARHREGLGEARRALGEARELVRAGAGMDLLAEALREATDALDGITGRTTPEDVLDRIFARFCIGK